MLGHRSYPPNFNVYLTKMVATRVRRSTQVHHRPLTTEMRGASG